MIYIGGFFAPLRAPRSTFAPSPTSQSALEGCWLFVETSNELAAFLLLAENLITPSVNSFFLVYFVYYGGEGWPGRGGGGREKNLLLRCPSLQKVPSALSRVPRVAESEEASGGFGTVSAVGSQEPRECTTCLSSRREQPNAFRRSNFL